MCSSSTMVTRRSNSARTCAKGVPGRGASNVSVPIRDHEYQRSHQVSTHARHQPWSPTGSQGARLRGSPLLRRTMIGQRPQSVTVEVDFKVSLRTWGWPASSGQDFHLGPPGNRSDLRRLHVLDLRWGYFLPRGPILSTAPLRCVPKHLYVGGWSRLASSVFVISCAVGARAQRNRQSPPMSRSTRCT